MQATVEPLWGGTKTGFLPSRLPLERLPTPCFQPLEDIVWQLPAHISGGKIKQTISALPALSIDTLQEVLISEV